MSATRRCPCHPHRLASRSVVRPLLDALLMCAMLSCAHVWAGTNGSVALPQVTDGAPAGTPAVPSNTIPALAADTNHAQWAVVASEFTAYTSVFSFLVTPAHEQASLLTQTLVMGRSSMPFKEKRAMAWRFHHKSKRFADVVTVVSNMMLIAASLTERHSALVILYYAALRHKEYEQGILACNTVIAEQKAQATPDAYYLLGAYKCRSELQAQMGCFQEGLDSAREALKAWESIPGAATDHGRTAGMIEAYGDALANVGDFATAIRFFKIVERLNPDEDYTHIFKVLAAYNRNRSLWNPKKRLFMRQY